MANPFVTDGTLGVNLRAIDVSLAATPLPWRTGQKVTANDGSEWMYVSSTAAIPVNSALFIDGNYGATQSTPALSSQATVFGRAHVSLSTSGQHFWAQLNGLMVVRVAAGAAANVPLYTTDTAGVLDDATVSLSQFQIMGLMAQGSNSAGGAGAITCVCAWPVIRNPRAGP